MTLRRGFWVGAAGLLGLAALISIVALIRGEFTETDGKILATLGAAFLGGSLALSGLALLDRRDLVPIGWLAVAGGGVGFCVLAYVIWSGFDHEKLLPVTLVLLPAGLIVTTARLLLSTSRLAWLYWCCAGLTSLAAAGTVLAILTEPDSEGWAQLIGSAWILAVLSWFLVPVLGRTAAASPAAKRSETIVGRGPGHVEVDLAEDEELVIRPAR